MHSRKVGTYTGDRLEVVDEVLSLLVSRPITLEVERREAGLFAPKSQESSRSKFIRRQIQRRRSEHVDMDTKISTYSVFGKLVQPEHVIVPAPADPILVHPAQEIVLSEILQGWGDDIPTGKRFDGLRWGVGVPLGVIGGGFGVVSSKDHDEEGQVIVGDMVGADSDLLPRQVAVARVGPITITSSR